MSMAITAASGNTGIARAAVSGNTVVVTGVSAGKTTLAIAAPEDDNHLAAEPINIDVVVAETE